MALDLSQLRFQVDTTELDRAGKAIGELVTNVGKLDKAARDAAQTEATLARAAKDNAKANLDNAKAQDVRLKSTIAADKADQALAASVEKKTKAIEKEAEATAKSTSILQKQKDILEFQTQGYSKGQSSILAYGKAAGLVAADIEELGKVLETQRKLMGGDPFDKSLSGLKSLQNQYTELKESIRQYNADSDLSSKQTRELARDKERLIEKMKVEGASFSEIRKAVRSHNEDYVKLAGQYNSLMSAEEAVIKSRKEIVAATNYVTQADQKMAAALNQSNAAIDKAGTDSLVRYENALRKSGVSQEVATQKLAAYKVQLEQVQKQELARREQHLTRALAPQATDVVVSLWSGQNPLTVLLQQGGQVTDLFMQSGIAAEKFGEVVKKSMASMLPSILTVVKGVGGLLVDGFMAAGYAVTNFLGQITLFSAASDKVYAFLASDGPSIAAQRWAKLSSIFSGVLATGIGAALGALIAFGVASVKAAAEQRELTSTLVMQGATLGLTTASAIDMAKSMNALGITTSDTIAVITEMAKAGNLTKDSIVMITEAAVNLNKWGGVAIADTVKTFSSIGKDPVDAMIKFAKETGLLSVEQIKLVDNLVKTEGKAAGVAEAMKLMGQAHSDAALKMKDEAGLLTRAWVGFLDILNKAKSAILDIGRTGFSEGDIASTQAKLNAAAKQMEGYAAASGVESGGYKQALAQYKDLSAELEKQLRLKKANSQETSTQTEENAKNARGVEYSIELGNKLDDRLKSLTKRQVTLKEYTDEYIAKLREKGTVEGENYEKAKKVAELEWKKAQEKPKSATSTLSVDKSNEIRILEDTYNRESQMQEKFLSDQLRIAKANYEMGYMSKAEYLDKELQLIHASQAEQKALAEKVLTDREQLYVKEVNNLLTAYQKRIDANKNLKNSEQADAEALQHLTNGVQNAYRAYEAFNQKVKDKNEILASKVTAQETEAMKILNDQVKKTTEAIAEYNRVNDLRIQQKKEDIATEDALRWATPEQAAVIRAMAEETKFYAAEISKFTKLAKAAKETLDDTINRFGVMSPQAQVALKGYNDAMNAVSQATADQRVAVEQAATDAIVKYQKDEYKRYVDGISDSIVTALFEGGKAGSKKLRNLIVDQLKKPVTLVVQAAVNIVLSSLMGSLGLGGLLGAGGGSNLLGMGLQGASLYNGLTSGSGILGTVGNFLGLGGSAYALGGASALGAASGVAAGGGLGLSATGGGLGISAPATGFFSGAGTASGSVVGAGASSGGFMSTLGTAMPWLMGASALALSWEKLFGRTLKDTGIQGQFGGETGFEGESYRFYEGGLFRSDKTTTEKLDEGIRKQLGNAFIAMRNQVTDFANILGLNTDKLKDFTTSLKLSLTGLKDNEIQAKIQEALATANNELAQQVIGTWETTTSTVSRQIQSTFMEMEAGAEAYRTVEETITASTYVASEYAREGEKAIDTLTRLAGSLSTVNNTFKNLGWSLYEASLAGAAASSKFVDLFGTMENFTQAVSIYYENFYTDAERAANVTRDITEALAKFGLETPKTREGYRALVEQQQKLGESGAEAVAALLKLSGAFASTTKSVEEVTDSVSKAQASERRAFVKARREAQEAEQKIIQDQIEASRKAAEEANKAAFDMFERIKGHITSINDWLKSTLLDTNSLLSPEQKVQEAQSQFNDVYAKALSGDEQALKEITSTAGSLRSIARDSYASSSAYAAIEQDIRNKLSALNAGMFAPKQGVQSSYEVQAGNRPADFNGVLNGVTLNLADVISMTGLGFESASLLTSNKRYDQSLLDSLSGKSQSEVIQALLAANRSMAFGAGSPELYKRKVEANEYLALNLGDAGFAQAGGGANAGNVYRMGLQFGLTDAEVRQGLELMGKGSQAETNFWESNWGSQVGSISDWAFNSEGGAQGTVDFLAQLNAQSFKTDKEAVDAIRGSGVANAQGMLEQTNVLQSIDNRLANLEASNRMGAIA